MSRQEHLEEKLESLETDVVIVARSLESMGKRVNKIGTKVTSIHHARSNRDSIVRLANELVDKLTDLKLVQEELKTHKKVKELL